VRCKSSASGVLYEILVPPKTAVPIGRVIGVIRELDNKSEVVEKVVEEEKQNLAEIEEKRKPEGKKK
jgi:pyruvate/2-oxoglutarate dehydrogenase complex dihydrolipoamide acyltransferase (E2) component